MSQKQKKNGISKVFFPVFVGWWVKGFHVLLRDLNLHDDDVNWCQGGYQPDQNQRVIQNGNLFLRTTPFLFDSQLLLD